MRRKIPIVECGQFNVTFTFANLFSNLRGWAFKAVSKTGRKHAMFFKWCKTVQVSLFEVNLVCGGPLMSTFFDIEYNLL